MSPITFACLETLERRQLLSGSIASSNEVTYIGATSGVSASAVAPQTTGVSVDGGTSNAYLDTAVNLIVQPGDGGGVKEQSLFYASQFSIFEVGPNTRVETGNITTSGGGDTLTVKPKNLLKANTQYRIEFNQRNDLSIKVTDVSNQEFVAATYTFTTGTFYHQPHPTIKFDKTLVSDKTSNGAYSAMTIAPDGRLYAGTLDGRIYRWTINANGTLSNEQQLNIIRNNNGGARFITGLTFDPRSTDPNNPVLWVSHGQAKFGDSQAEYADNHTGKISRLYGNDLGTYQDVVINIPRSVKDHLNNQISFDPVRKNLYFLIPSMSAMGRADTTWGGQSEELTTAAMIRLQLHTKGTRLGVEDWLATKGAINLDPSAGYNPYKGTNPLRFYATGIRNAFDGVWHSNGHFYVAGNSSASGGNTPATPANLANVPSTNRLDYATKGNYTGPVATAITAVNQTIEDFLFDIEEGGYYGHPNPTRGEYVLNGGNPTSSTDPFQIGQYPVGTQPDRNYRQPEFSFGKNQSPDGMIEYKGNAFGGLLKGALIVARYSSGDDLTILFPNADGTINSNNELLGTTGMTGFTNPLDLVEDPKTGNIFVASLVDRFGKGQIHVLKPRTGQASVDTTRVRFFATAGDRNGATKNVTLTNSGNGNLTVDVSAIRITGKDRGNFVVTNLPAQDFTLTPGQTKVFNVKFVARAGDTTVRAANLAIATSDPDTFYTVTQLRGSGVVPAKVAPAAKKAALTAAPNISAGPRTMYFNAVHGNTDTRTLTINNTGNANLDLKAGAISVLGTYRTRFTVVGFPEAGVSIKPGRRLELKVTFDSRASDDMSVKVASIRIRSTDPETPNTTIVLRALPTTGVGSSNEPSLQKVINTFGLPINVGDNSPDEYQLGTPNANSQEVTVQSLVKAGKGPVSIRPLAVFGTDNGPAVRVGTYTPGVASDLQQLWYVPRETAQSVNPIVYGQTLIDPGDKPFALFAEFPGFTNTTGQQRYVYSEDGLNSVWEPSTNSANLRKFRFYPFKDQYGNAAPNTYVVAVEEFTELYDYQDVVFVISNVKPLKDAANVATIGWQNVSGFPSNDRMVFSKVEIPDELFPNKTHLTNVMRIRNTGTAPLVASFQTTGSFVIDKGGGTNVTIAPGGVRDVTVRYTATGGSIHNGTLVITSNDPDHSTVTIQLAGRWQQYSEFRPSDRVSVEPTARQIVQDLFGYTTVLNNPGQALSTGGRVRTTGDEILSPYWTTADDNAPVRVTQLASFHGQWYTDAKTGKNVVAQTTMQWYKKGQSNKRTTFLKHAPNDGQTVLPRRDKPTSSNAAASFNPQGEVFGFSIENNEYSDPTINPDIEGRTGYGHFIRFWPAYDANGVLIPNTYLMLHDYNRVFTNFDYNDNVYLVQNVVPEGEIKSPLTVFTEETSKGARISFTSPATGPRITGFNIYRSTDPKSGYELLTDTPLARRPTTTFIDTSVTANQTFWYRITSVGTGGAESAPVTVRV